jgi:hypothetical protein
VQLWALIQNVHLNEDMEDDIYWKLTSNGEYSTTSTYNLQFFGLTESSFHKIVWKAWATPKAKHHAWLALQNRLWTADKLRRRGWDNCGLCPLCKKTKETNNHHFVHSRFTIRVWELLDEWIGMQRIQLRQWPGLNIQEWWSSLAEGPSNNRKGLTSLTLLIFWEIWQERNAHIFYHKLAPSFVIIDKIKGEARLWVLAGVKKLGDLIPGE